MKSACKMPDLQMALLRSRPLSGNALEPEVALHSDICDDCQAAALRPSTHGPRSGVAEERGWRTADAADFRWLRARFAAAFPPRRKENGWQGSPPLRIRRCPSAAAALLVVMRWMGPAGHRRSGPRTVVTFGDRRGRSGFALFCKPFPAPSDPRQRPLNRLPGRARARGFPHVEGTAPRSDCR